MQVPYSLAQELNIFETHNNNNIGFKLLLLILNITNNYVE